MEAKLVIVNTYCALVCVAESFQSTQIELLLDESKPEDALQEHTCCSPTAAQHSAHGSKLELPQRKILSVVVC